jgi:hypothetical protein
MKNRRSKYKTKETSVENVQLLFQNTTEDRISVGEAYKAWGRDTNKVEENKIWLSNKLTSLKFHNLVSPIYTVINNRRVLNAIQLTIEGKRALGRIGENVEVINAPPNQSNELITIDAILKAIPRLKKENPDFDIVFKVNPKNS